MKKSKTQGMGNRFKGPNDSKIIPTMITENNMSKRHDGKVMKNTGKRKGGK